MGEASPAAVPRRCSSCREFRRTDASILNPATGEKVWLGQCLSSRSLANRVFGNDSCEVWEAKDVPVA
jgi:hypothetical protein